MGSLLMDALPPARRWIIDNMISDGPTIRELASDETTCEEWIRKTVLGHWHASCSCKMGADTDPMAVTSPPGEFMAWMAFGLQMRQLCQLSLVLILTLQPL